MPAPKKTETSDLEMMQTPDLWPAWPALPVKRYKQGESWPECGVLINAHDPDKPNLSTTVFVVNLFELSGKSLAWLETQTQYEYVSYEEMVAAGWVID